MKFGVQMDNQAMDSTVSSSALYETGKRHLSKLDAPAKLLKRDVLEIFVMMEFDGQMDNQAIDSTVSSSALYETRKSDRSKLDGPAKRIK